MNSASYLLSVIKPPDSLLGTMDELARQAAGMAGGIPKQSAPQAEQRGWGRFISAIWAVAREAVRFYLQLKHPHSRRTMASRLLTWLEADFTREPSWTNSVGALRADLAKSWCSRFSEIRKRALDLGVSMPQASDLALYRDASTAATVFARAAAWADEDRTATRYVVKKHGTGAISLLQRRSVSVRPPPFPPALHLAGLAFGYGLPALEVRRLLGKHAYHTAVSMVGIGSGRILSLCNDAHIPEQHRLCLGSLPLGRLGLLRFCFPHDDMLFRVVQPTAQGCLERRRQRAYCSNSPCPLCQPGAGEVAEPLSPWHVFLECQHPSVLAARQDMLVSAPRILTHIVTLACEAQAHEASATLDGDAAALAIERASSLRNAVQSAMLRSFSSVRGDDGEISFSDDLSFALYRILLVRPWPACAVDQDVNPSSSLSALLGALFDATNVTHFRLRSLANIWTRWSGAQCHLLCSVWADAVKGQLVGC